MSAAVPTCSDVLSVAPQLKNQLITEEGKVGTEMYFIVEGEVEVMAQDERLGFLGTGSFFGENPVIEAIEGKGGDGSEIRMRTIRATGPCDLGFLRVNELCELMGSYPELSIRLNQFRTAGAKVSKKGTKLGRIKAEMAALQASKDTAKKEDPNALSSAAGISQKLLELNSRRIAEMVKMSSDVEAMKARLQADAAMIQTALSNLTTTLSP